MISIHAPRTGSDISFSTSSIVSRHFNPRSPHGERLDSMSSNSMKSSFQSTLPARGATIRPRFSATKSRHFNPRSPHGERRAALRVLRVIRRISIHAPRTGSDGHSFLFARLKYLFQSTLPARGATSSCSGRVPVLIYFNPRSPHGERPGATSPDTTTGRFQSTLPARGATRRCSPGADTSDDFNPRSPHGERLADVGVTLFPAPISIHAPRTGSDFSTTIVPSSWVYFNPRSPHGERQDTTFSGVCPTSFQSTLPARGATRLPPRGTNEAAISIHAPRTGSDRRCSLDLCSLLISIHAPRTGSDSALPRSRRPFPPDFNPRSPHGERLETGAVVLPYVHFNPRSPHGERQSRVDWA